MHHKHPRQEIFLKKRPLGMNQLKRLNLKGQIQNEIGFFYLGHLGVGVILDGVHLSLVKVIV
jgi:hypothetical protein